MSIEIKTELLAFTTGFYAKEVVKDKCLELQNIHHASVDIILWLCWLDANQIFIKQESLKAALDIVGGVNQELLDYLREARAQLLAASSFTRVQDKLISKHIVSAELAIEKVLLQRLQDLTSRLEKIDVNEESLSLFDYLDSLTLDESGETSANLLEHSRAYMNKVGEPAH